MWCGTAETGHKVSREPSCRAAVGLQGPSDAHGMVQAALLQDRSNGAVPGSCAMAFKAVTCDSLKARQPLQQMQSLHRVHGQLLSLPTA